MKLLALVDCDSFYASCERIFRPDLKSKPVVVLSNNDGCVIARSKEAKDLGIEMGIPWFKVKQKFLAHKGHVFSSNFALYGDISKRVMHVLSNIAKSIEVYSVDEAFLDLDNLDLKSYRAGTDFAIYCRNLIWQWIGIPVRIGIAPTKTLTKIASYLAKTKTKYPGIFCITNKKQIQSALKQVPLRAVWGIGNQLNKKLGMAGLKTAYDLANVDARLIRDKYSVMLERTVRELNGERCLELEEHPPTKKQIIVSRSFSKNIIHLQDLSPIMKDFGVRAGEKLRKEKQLCSQIGVFIRTSPFRAGNMKHQASKLYALPGPTNDTRDILHGIKYILPKIFKEGYLYAKAGVLLKGFVDYHVKQYSLFDDQLSLKQNDVLMTQIDQINAEEYRINFAAKSKINYTNIRRARVSPRYTTKLNELPIVNRK